MRKRRDRDTGGSPDQRQIVLDMGEQDPHLPGQRTGGSQHRAPEGVAYCAAIVPHVVFADARRRTTTTVTFSGVTHRRGLPDGGLGGYRRAPPRARAALNGDGNGARRSTATIIPRVLPLADYPLGEGVRASRKEPRTPAARCRAPVRGPDDKLKSANRKTAGARASTGTLDRLSWW